MRGQEVGGGAVGQALSLSDGLSSGLVLLTPSPPVSEQENLCHWKYVSIPEKLSIV